MKASQIYVSGPRLTTLAPWKSFGAHVTTNNGEIVNEADVIFLSVKPHILPVAISSVLQTYTPGKATNKLFISVLAGTTLEALENVCITLFNVFVLFKYEIILIGFILQILSNIEGARVIRVMPNTPLLVGEGCTVYCPGQHATEADIKLVQSIFEVSGICELVPESLINVIGALSGSGPAYVRSRNIFSN